MRLYFYGVLPVQVPANAASSLLAGAKRDHCIQMDFGNASADEVNAVLKKWQGKRPEFTKTKMIKRKNKK